MGRLPAIPCPRGNKTLAGLGGVRWEIPWVGWRGIPEAALKTRAQINRNAQGGFEATHLNKSNNVKISNNTITTLKDLCPALFVYC